MGLHEGPPTSPDATRPHYRRRRSAPSHTKVGCRAWWKRSHAAIPGADARVMVARMIRTGPTRDGPLPWFDAVGPPSGVAFAFMGEHVNRARANLARDAFDAAFARGDLEAADAALADLQAAEHGNR